MKNEMTKGKKILCAAIAFLLFCSVSCAVIFGLLWRRAERAIDAYAASENAYDRSKLAELLRLFREKSTHEEPSVDDLTDGMLRGAVSAYGDPYAAYYDAVEYDAYRLGLEGQLYGIGITYTEAAAKDGLLVLDVFPDSPAETAGMKAGDVIVRVNGKTRAELDYDAFCASIGGAKDTELSLSVRRGSTELPLSLTRGEVTKRTVIFHAMAEDTRVAYVRITGFDGHTFAQFKNAIDTLSSDGCTGWIFDLRGNGGGTLDSVCRMLAYLLPDGDIVTVDYADEKAEDYTVTAVGDAYTFASRPETFADAAHVLDAPIAVLCDGGTASAAELFTAALRDYSAEDKADVTTVGTLTYGKGTVQTTYSFPDGSAVKLTVAHYMPPCGVCYDGVGITPDIPVTLPDGTPNIYLRTLAEDPQWQAALAAIAAKLDG